MKYEKNWYLSLPKKAQHYMYTMHLMVSESKDRDKVNKDLHDAVSELVDENERLAAENKRLKELLEAVSSGEKDVRKEIHFYEDGSEMPIPTLCTSWNETKKRINEDKPYIATTQMALLSTNLFERGYSIYIHPAQGKSYEIKLGLNTCTDREIRLTHDLFKMWAAGEFSAN